MIITKLTFHNFGVYAGNNVFEFESSKPVVLIGGMNGRGKTTFLEGVLLALYGANSFAYSESKYSSYGQYLKAFVNTADGSLETYVTELVREDTVLVSIMHVNNETGIIQPIKEIGEFLADKETFFHIDATQSFGKLVDELKAIKYDMLSMSAHKIAGPQGVGTLVLRKKRYKLPPVKGIMYGGQQERGIRPGTIPVALVVGLGTACALVASEYKQNQEKCLTIKNALLEELNASGVKCEINGDQNYCVPSTLNICFNGVSSEALMLSTKQYCGISNGSACNSKSYEPSYVLTAMGIPTEKIENTVRISWGAESDCEDVVTSFKKLLAVAKSFAAF